MVVSHEESRRPRDAGSGKVDQLFDVRASSANTTANTIRLRESSRLILSMITSATCPAEGPCHGAHSRAAVTITRVARAALVHPGPLRPMRKRRGGRGVAFDDGVLYRVRLMALSSVWGRADRSAQGSRRCRPTAPPPLV